MLDREVDHAVADHHVEAAVLERRSVDVALDVGDVAHAAAPAQRFSLDALCIGHVQADDGAGRAGDQAGEEAVHAGSAAQVEHARPFHVVEEVEVVTDSGERVDRLGGNAVEVGRSVAEALGHHAAHLEVELAVRVPRDVSVHGLDLGFEIGAVDLFRHGDGLGHNVLQVKTHNGRDSGQAAAYTRTSGGLCSSGFSAVTTSWVNSALAR